MRVTILPYAIILTKACWAVISMMAKGNIVALRCFLFSLPNNIHVNAVMVQHF